MRRMINVLESLINGMVEHLQEEMNHFTSLSGAWMELTEFVVLYPAAMALLWIVFGFFFALQREWRLPLDPNSRLSVAVVIPAHNEEQVIARAIEYLLQQNYQNMQIHVVSDGSGDATVEITRRYENKGVILHVLARNRGKSVALQYVLERVNTDLFMVVDADTEAEPDAIEFMVQQFIDPRVGAVTGHPRVRNVTNLLTAIQKMEYAVIVSLAKRAEQFWGGLYTVSGAAACFRTSALRGIGGWSERSVTEDIEVSWRMQKAGWLLSYEPRALFHIQAPVKLLSLYRQRTRWAQGMAEVVRLHWNIAFTRNTALIPIAVQVFATALWMLLMTLVVVKLLIAILVGAIDMSALQSSSLLDWHIVFYWTFALFALQAFTACVLDANYIRGVWKTFPLFIVYPLYYWIVIYPSFLFGVTRGLISKGSGRWKRTERTVSDSYQD